MDVCEQDCVAAISQVTLRLREADHRTGFEARASDNVEQMADLRE
jgi:hypothetical protein